jgi:hypothetical protein
MRNKLLIVLFVFVLLSTITFVFAFTPTSEWKDFYGKASGGKVGNLITAKDPNGTICGQFTIASDGTYGFLPVYADDSLTSADEGAKAGDNITFYFNNKSVGIGVWDANKDIINLDLVLVKCNESWKCSSWSKCINSTQTRTCTDSNKCGTAVQKPAESQACKCVESWTCTSWSKCVKGIATRKCNDLNLCGTILSKPSEKTTCIAIIWNLIH